MFNSFLGSTLFFIFSRRFRINSSSLSRLFRLRVDLVPERYCQCSFFWLVFINFIQWTNIVSVFIFANHFESVEFRQKFITALIPTEPSSRFDQSAFVFKRLQFTHTFPQSVVVDHWFTCIKGNSFSEFLPQITQMVWDSQKDAIIVCFWEEYSPLPKGL